MMMLGRATHLSALDCHYGCCLAPGQYDRKGRKMHKRSRRRIEDRTWRKDVEAA